MILITEIIVLGVSLDTGWHSKMVRWEGKGYSVNTGGCNQVYYTGEEREDVPELTNEKFN